jgi:hypothetical protein
MLSVLKLLAFECQMSEHQRLPVIKPSRSQYVQPLVLAFLAGLFGFGYSYHSRGDVKHALFIGGFTCLVIFWVVLRGNKLVKQRESKSIVTSNSVMSKPSNWRRRWQIALIAGTVLLGLLITLNYAINVLSRPQVLPPPPGYEPNEDDAVIRVRKISFRFWSEMSANPHPSFEPGVDAALAALDFPIHSIEKNWPKGPTVVTYEGTAKDAEKIYKALRSQGVPIHPHTTIGQ